MICRNKWFCRHVDDDFGVRLSYRIEVKLEIGLLLKNKTKTKKIDEALIIGIII